MDTGLSPTTPNPASRPMDGIAIYIYLLIENSQPALCYPKLYGGGGGGGVHDTPCVLVLLNLKLNTKSDSTNVLLFTLFVNTAVMMKVALGRLIHPTEYHA